MELLAAWLLYPLALAALSLGLGLLVGRAADWRLPGALLLPVGLGALFALSRLITWESATAPLALPAVALLAVAGLALDRRWLRAARPEPWLAAGALTVFAVLAAPIVLGGAPSFAGYLALPDTSHQLSLAHLFAHHGPDWTALAGGSNQISMSQYVESAYPVAPQTALGVTEALGAIDLAWLYQPLITVIVVAAALAIAALVAPWVRSAPLRALIAVAAAVPALVVGFALQGSMKELAFMAMLLTGAAVLSTAAAQGRPGRSLLPLAVVAAAAFGSLGPAAGPYLAPLALAAAVVWGVRIVRRRAGREALWVGAGAVLFAALSWPMLRTLDTALTVNTATLDAEKAVSPVAGPDLGNLAGPLQAEQALGTWFSGDYRYPGTNNLIAQDLILGLTALAALIGIAWAVRRRAWGPLLTAVAGVAISAYLLRRGSPYADAKVLAITSPLLLVLAGLGVAGLWRGRTRVLAAGLGGAIALGILVSAAMAYHDVSPAPQDRYEELHEINDRLDRRGPAIFFEYDEFAKYFLRDVPALSQPEWAHGYRGVPYAPNALVDTDRRPSLKTPLDPDDLTLEYLEGAPYLVLRRGPLTSRPPASFRRVWVGEHYEVWRRSTDVRVLAHEPLGPDVFHPAAPPDCRRMRALGADAARAGGRLAFVERTNTRIFETANVTLAENWFPFAGYPAAVVPAGPGHARGPLRIFESGRYTLWIEGSFARENTVRVDGRVVGRPSDHLNNPGAYLPLGPIELEAGQHRVEITSEGGNLEPGDGGHRSSLRHTGPVVFSSPSNERLRVQTVAAEDWRELCGRRLDWVEVVAG